jgi:hypothetical protein
LAGTKVAGHERGRGRTRRARTWPGTNSARRGRGLGSEGTASTARLAGNPTPAWHDHVVPTQADIGWLTIRLTEPNARRLNATLAAIVERAHACGLRAATITHSPGEVPVPRQTPRQITLPDGVRGTVTVADLHAKLREFVVQIGDLLRARATVEIDGTAVALDRQPVGS